MPQVMRTAVLALLASAGPALVQAQGFEGVVNWQMTSNNGPIRDGAELQGDPGAQRDGRGGPGDDHANGRTSPNMIMIMPEPEDVHDDGPEEDGGTRSRG